MNLTQVSQTFGNQKHDWLGSADGLNYSQSCTLKVSAFTANTHYPQGYVPSGLAIALPASGANAGFAVPLAARPSEGQTVTITGTPTGGTFTLTFDGETSAAIAYNASAATVTTALEGLSNIRVGTVVVTGGPGPGTPYVVTFSGAQYQGTDVPQMSATASLTGGTSPAVAVTTTTAGGSGATDGSDTLAGFIKFPTAVPTGATAIVAPYIYRGRINNARLPIPLSAAQIATNPRFVIL